MLKRTYEFELNNTISLEEFQEIRSFIYKNLNINFSEIKPNITSQFIEENESIPHKYKSITFSFDSNDDDYETKTREIEHEIKKLGY